MTTPVQEAVRRACDEARPAAPCRWPDCYCEGLDLRKMLTTLIAQARAEGAAQEREACAQLMETQNEDEDGDLPELILKVRRLGRKLRAAAIRARKEETP